VYLAQNHITTAATDSTVVCIRNDITDNRVVVYQNAIQKDITIVLPPPQIDEPRPRPIRNPVFQPPVREIAAPWQAKWRLTQQRARDGLR
jgi:hypothetical protein